MFVKLIGIAAMTCLVAFVPNYAFAQSAGGESASVGNELVETSAPGSIDELVNQCAVISVLECDALVTAYIDDLEFLGLSDEEFSQQMADLVVAFTVLAQTNSEVSEIASSAIRVAAGRTIDVGQQEQFIGIADTIESGSDFQTAAIAPQASPN